MAQSDEYFDPDQDHRREILSDRTRYPYSWDNLPSQMASFYVSLGRTGRDSFDLDSVETLPNPDPISIEGENCYFVVQLKHPLKTALVAFADAKTVVRTISEKSEKILSSGLENHSDVNENSRIPDGFASSFDIVEFV